MQWFLALIPFCFVLGLALFPWRSGSEIPARNRLLTLTLLIPPLLNIALGFIFAWHGPGPVRPPIAQPWWMGWLIFCYTATPLVWSVAFLWFLAADFLLSATLITVPLVAATLFTEFGAGLMISGGSL